MTFRFKFRPIVASFAFAALAFSATASYADDAKVPSTTAEHDAMAKQYKEQAAQFKKVGDEHRAMAATYGKEHPDGKGAIRNPYNEKMQKHCAMLAKDADKLAADADKAAEFHTMRGKELQGK